MNHNPLNQNERIELIDALRGFALFGILMVNMLYMYAPMTQVMLGAKADASMLQIIAESFIKFFFEGKFYVIFSMLFGYGFYIFMNKSNANNAPILPVFKRRLIILLIFGLAHIALLWVGDVLVYYSLFGFVLIIFRNASDTKIIKWAVILGLLPAFLLSLLTLLVALMAHIPEAKAQMDIEFEENIIIINNLVERAYSVYSSGTFTEMISFRIEEYLFLANGSILFFCPVILAMFLVGFWAARKGLLAHFNNNISFFRKTFWWGLFIGIISNVLYTISYHHAQPNVPGGWSLVFASMHTFGGFSLGLCYVSGIILLFNKEKEQFFVQYIAPVGRMALTNYIMQSTITALLFHAYGLGFYGKVEAWQGIALTVLIYLLQIAFSRCWLKHFQFGPLEWLWRSLTYLKLQKMKKN